MNNQQNRTQQNNTTETLGERIKNAREKRGWGQAHAAAEFDVHHSTWNRYEHDKRSVPPEVLQKICKEWHISADYLLLGEKDTANLIDLSDLSLSQRHTVMEVVKAFRRD